MHSIKSEVKHFPYEYYYKQIPCELIKEKVDIIKKIFSVYNGIQQISIGYMAIFYLGPWGEGFGGKRWAKAVAEMKKYMSLKSRFQKCIGVTEHFICNITPDIF